MQNTLESSTTSLIREFPPELLSNIFEYLDPTCVGDVIRTAAVCHQWREVAKANSALWVCIRISYASLRRDPKILARLLQRSKDRLVSIHLRLIPDRPAAVGARLKPLLNILVKHLERCEELSVYATEEACDTIAAAFAGKNIPRLRRLRLESDDAEMHWQVSPYGDDGWPAPPAYIPFPVLAGPLLAVCHLRGFTLGPGNAHPRNLRFLRIENHHPDMVINDGLNHPLFTDVEELELDGICVPGMNFPSAAVPSTAELQAATRLEYLTLSQLRATPSYAEDEDESVEWDCAPFFYELNTARLVHLAIERWDLMGRVLDDFIDALALTQTHAGAHKFPRVAFLSLREMYFGVYGHLAIFLAAFPALEYLSVRDAPSLWEDIFDVLEMHPTLCPLLKALECEVGVMFVAGLRRRDLDPLPFRNHMLAYPPVEADGPYDFDV